MSSVIENVLNGEVIILPQHLQRLNLFNQFQTTFLNSIKRHCGGDVYTQIVQEGLEQFHKLVPTEQVMRVYKRVESELYRTLPKDMIKIAQSIGMQRPFYTHRDAFIRIMVPIEHLDDSFKCRPGRLYPYSEVHQDSFRTIDQVINFWMAIGHVKEENGMEIYTDMWGQDLPLPGFNAIDESMGEPVRYALDPGDILVFHSRHIHTTVLNHTDQTRIVVTGRVGFSIREGDVQWNLVP